MACRCEAARRLSASTCASRPPTSSKGALHAGQVLGRRQIGASAAAHHGPDATALPGSRTHSRRSAGARAEATPAPLGCCVGCAGCCHCRGKTARGLGFRVHKPARHQWNLRPPGCEPVVPSKPAWNGTSLAVVTHPRSAMGRDTPRVIHPGDPGQHPGSQVAQSASSSTSTQCRTGRDVPPCRCAMQPILADRMASGGCSPNAAPSTPSLRSRSGYARPGWSTE